MDGGCHACCVVPFGSSRCDFSFSCVSIMTRVSVFTCDGLAQVDGIGVCDGNA